MKPVKKCYECLDFKPLEHFGIKKRDDKGKEILWGSCIQCKDKLKSKKLNEQKKINEQKTSDKGVKTCKKCKKSLKLTLFEQKKNGGIYVNCKECQGTKSSTH